VNRLRRFLNWFSLDPHEFAYLDGVVEWRTWIIYGGEATCRVDYRHLARVLTAKATDRGTG